MSYKCKTLAAVLTVIMSFQVDGQRNRTRSSPGPLLGLDVFNQLFLGGYNEYTPELLPLGSRFRDGFQGKSSKAPLQPTTIVWIESTGPLSFY